MHFTTASITAGLLALQPVAADFLVFSGVMNQAPDPVAINQYLFFNNPPDCDDVRGAVAHVPNPENDASTWGIACDGCDGGKAPQDQDIKRWEFHDREGNDATFTNAGDNPHFTLYVNPDDGGYNIIDTDGNSLGTCVRPDDPQDYNCPDLLSGENGVHIFTCTTDMTVVDSN